MSGQALPVKSAVLQWAVDEDGRDLPSIAHAAGASLDELEAWLHGESLPSSGDISRLASALKRPRTLFLLPSAPERATLPPDFRHFPGSKREPSPDAIRAIRRSRRVQRSLAWALRGEGSVEIPQAQLTEDSADAAERFRAWLGVSTTEQLGWKDDRAALAVWREALDERDILVFQLEIGKGEARGFSSWDENAPLIALNVSRESPSARIYTLAHELGHLALREDASCIEVLGPGKRLHTGVDPEAWCERFSAAFLMPRKAFVAEARKLGVQSKSAGIPEVRSLMQTFNVSARATANRLIDLGLAEMDLYPRVLAVFKPAPPSEPSQSRDFRRPARSTTRRREYGDRTLRTILNAVPPQDALSILRLDTEDVRKISEEVPGIDAF